MTDESLQKAAMPFEENRQSALLGCIFSDPILFERLNSLIQPDWFTNVLNNKLMSLLLEYYKVYAAFPKSEDDFFSSQVVMKEKADERIKLKAQFQKCISYMKSYTITSMTKDVEDWMKFVYLRHIMKISEKHFNNRELNKAANVISEKIQGFFDLKLDNRDEEKLLSPMDIFTKSVESQIGACTTGSALLDLLMNESATAEGGLLKKEMSLVMAPMNVGKSTFLINVSMANIYRGKRVLFVALEDTPQNLKEKIWTTYLDESSKALELYAKSPGMISPDKASRFKAGAKMVGDNFVFMPYVKSEMTLETVIAAIKIKYQESLGKVGKGFDLIVCDYPAILQTEWVKGGGDSMTRAKLDHVYRTFSNLAQQLDCHVMAAIQTNRAAAKNNRNQGDYNTENRVVVAEDVSEGYAPMQIANSVISLNRGTEDQNQNIMYVHVAKTRKGPAGPTLITKTNFAHGRSHGWDLPSCYYYGTKRLDTVTALKCLSRYKEYPDGKIPLEELTAFSLRNEK